MAKSTTELTPRRQLLLGLSRLGQAVRLSAWRQAGPSNLTPLQADIVIELARASGPRRPGDLAVTLASTPPTVSDAVRTLQAKSLVQRTRDPADGRAAAVALTPAGRDAANGLDEVPEPLADALAALDDGDVAAALRIVTVMIRTLQEHRAIPVSRTCVTCRFYRPGSTRDLPHHCDFLGTDFADQQLRIECAEHRPTHP